MKKFIIELQIITCYDEIETTLLFLESENKDLIIEKIENHIDMFGNMELIQDEITNTWWFIENNLKNSIMAKAILENYLKKLKLEKRELDKEYIKDPILGDYDVHSYGIYEIDKLEFKKVE